MLGADPFLASLRRHRLAAWLIALQAALTTLVLALAMAKAVDLHARATRPSGVDEARLMRLRVRGPLDAASRWRERDALGRLEGVASVRTINQVPFGMDDWSADVSAGPGRGVVRATLFLGDEDLRAQLGVPLRAGRDFLADEYVPMQLHEPERVLIDTALARQLFHDGPVLGRTLRMVGAPTLRVVGVYAPFRGPREEGRPSLILPTRLPIDAGADYLLRLRSDAPPPVERIAAALATTSSRRWVSDYRSIGALREAYFLHDRWQAVGLWLGVGLWLLCTGVGLANLADLLLQARVRQIGLCRALGARSAQIRWQLRREHLLLTGAGALTGLALLHLLLRAWPWLGQQLETGGVGLQAFAVGLVLLAGQCAMWPITREADAVPLASGMRWA